MKTRVCSKDRGSFADGIVSSSFSVDLVQGCPDGTLVYHLHEPNSTTPQRRRLGSQIDDYAHGPRIRYQNRPQTGIETCRFTRLLRTAPGFSYQAAKVRASPDRLDLQIHDFSWESDMTGRDIPQLPNRRGISPKREPLVGHMFHCISSQFMAGNIPFISSNYR